MVCGLEGSEGRLAGGGGGGGLFPNDTDPDGFPIPCWFKAAILWESVVNCGSSTSAIVAAFYRRSCIKYAILRRVITKLSG